MMHEQPRIPTLLALAILIFGLSALIYLVENVSQLIARARENTEPRAVTVANISDDKFSVSWITDTPTLGAIEYKEEKVFSLPRLAFDIRDENSPNRSRSTHYINVNNALPNTRYEITILNGGKAHSKLQIETGPSLSVPEEVKDPAFGILLDEKNKPVTEGIALASFSDSQTLSTLIGSDGSWILPIGLIRTTDLKRYFEPEAEDRERLFFLSPKGETTVITNLGNDSPLPNVRLGETYDLTKSQSHKNPGLIIAQANNFSALSGKVNSAFVVILPTENSSIPSGKPAFKGIGTSGKRVIITLNSKHISLAGKTTVSSNGNWSWTPPETLIPDSYTVTVTSFDEQNAPITKSVNFSVLKSGTSVLGEATPAASINPSPSPAISPSPSTIASPSASPIITPPVTGTWEPTLIIFLLGTGLLIFGGALLVRVPRN